MYDEELTICTIHIVNS